MAVAQFFIPDTPAPTPPHRPTLAFSLSTDEDDPEPCPQAPPPSPEQPRRTGAFFDAASMSKLEQLHRAQSSPLEPRSSLDFTQVFKHGSHVASYAADLFHSPEAPPNSLDFDLCPLQVNDAHLHLQTPSPEESISGIPLVAPSHLTGPPFYSQSAPPLSNLSSVPELPTFNPHATSPLFNPLAVSPCSQLHDALHTGRSPAPHSPPPSLSNATLPPAHCYPDDGHELHQLHPHLPVTFETVVSVPGSVTSVPGSVSSSVRSGFTDSGFVDDSSGRRRKVSLKRKNDELENSLLSSLESTESDWVVLGQHSTVPHIKKACQDPLQPVRHRSSSASNPTRPDSHRFSKNLTSLAFSSGIGATPTSNAAIFTQAVESSPQPSSSAGVGTVYAEALPSLAGYHERRQHQASHLAGSASSPLPRPPLLVQVQQASGEGGQLSSLTSVDSLQPMDCADDERFDSLDSMDTGSLDFPPTGDNVEMDSINLTSLSFYSGHPGATATESSPLSTATYSSAIFAAPSSVGHQLPSHPLPLARSHSSASGSVHTFVSPGDHMGSFHTTPRQSLVQDGSFLGIAATNDLGSASRFNFSKSL